MSTEAHILVMVVVGYLFGSIPFARLFTIRTGVDLFETGTGNPGAANVFRKIDKRIGVAVFLADVLKGTVPIVIAWAMGAPEDFWIVAGGAAIFGHWYPIFSGFRGGAGLATGTGVVLALIPIPGIIGIVVGITAIWRLQSSGHAALIGVIVILALAVPFGAEWPAMVSTVGVAAFLFAKAIARGWKPGPKD